MDFLYTFVKSNHSYLRYFLLLVLVVTIIKTFTSWKASKKFTEVDNRLSLVTFIFAHIQLLFGLYLYLIGPNGLALFSKGMSEVMSISLFRFFAVEHIFGMLIAIALITVGRIKAKKLSTDTAKHKTTFIYYLIALIIMLVTIPWPFRNMGTAWI